MNIMTESYIDKLWESKDNLELIQNQKYKINYDKAIEHLSRMKNGYVPILLKPYLKTGYISTQSPEIIEQFEKAYLIYSRTSGELREEFMDKDLLGWVEENPQYKDMLTLW